MVCGTAGGAPLVDCECDKASSDCADDLGIGVVGVWGEASFDTKAKMVDWSRFSNIYYGGFGKPVGF